MNRFACLILFAAACGLPVSALAGTITGKVIDRTANKPATGEAVMLLDPAHGMRESARTIVDTKGHYSFTVPGNAGMYLVRMEHQKTAYDGPAAPGATSPRRKMTGLAAASGFRSTRPIRSRNTSGGFSAGLRWCW